MNYRLNQGLMGERVLSSGESLLKNQEIKWRWESNWWSTDDNKNQQLNGHLHMTVDAANLAWQQPSEGVMLVKLKFKSIEFRGESKQIDWNAGGRHFDEPVTYRLMPESENFAKLTFYLEVYGATEEKIISSVIFTQMPINEPNKPTGLYKWEFSREFPGFSGQCRHCNGFFVDMANFLIYAYDLDVRPPIEELIMSKLNDAWRNDT